MIVKTDRQSHGGVTKFFRFTIINVDDFSSYLTVNTCNLDHIVCSEDDAKHISALLGQNPAVIS